MIHECENCGFLYHFDFVKLSRFHGSGKTQICEKDFVILLIQITFFFDKIFAIRLITAGKSNYDNKI
ncbi:hypothetical protein BpHYR1_025101 [Brachionus plicatilis]|uniref:Uncharacterized protein n=1 Tax=Brachionus plicatilis TaxID=10195 RepID=A0A3M7RGT4_BRAPC|nr:hypothetical protein BpHYR1_025101 [Brachionus plicatilis]